MRDSDLPQPKLEKGKWDENLVKRRHFLEYGFWTASSIMSLAMGAVGIRFLAGDSLAPSKEQWVEVGNIVDYAAGKVHKVNYTAKIKDVWRKVEKKSIVYVYSDDGIAYTALDATCTHLGCNVRWKQDDEQFSCPCHNAFFSRDGVVISGPPPRPLQRLATKIENDILLIQI